MFLNFFSLPNVPFPLTMYLWLTLTREPKDIVRSIFTFWINTQFGHWISKALIVGFMNYQKIKFCLSIYKKCDKSVPLSISSINVNNQTYVALLDVFDSKIFHECAANSNGLNCHMKSLMGGKILLPQWILLLPQRLIVQHKYLILNAHRLFLFSCCYLLFLHKWMENVIFFIRWIPYKKGGWKSWGRGLMTCQSSWRL